MTVMHDDPEIVAFVASIPIEEKPLDWIIEQLPEVAGTLLGDVTAVDYGDRWGYGIERREGLPAKAIEVFDEWARARLVRLITTKDPTIDGWIHYSQTDTGTPVDAWHVVCVGTDEMPDMSFLDQIEGDDLR